MRVILGLDTSNYVTSVAAVDLSGKPVLDVRKPLTVQPGKRGLQQSEAVFQHEQNLPALIAGQREFFLRHPVAAVSVSATPRPGLDSYMPVFVVGRGHGEVCAHLLGVPFFTTNHQDGHIRAARQGTSLPVGQNFLAVHLSGGTTEVLSVTSEGSHLLGGSLDLFAGQLVDRVGVALGLPFPAGPHLERLAAKGRTQSALGVSIQGMDCHLSGAEAQVMRWIAEGSMPKEDVAAEVYDFLIRTVARLLEAAWRETGEPQVLLAGGVSSSERLRRGLRDRLEQRRIPLQLHLAQPGLSGDNAVGVALIGLEQYQQRGEE